MLRVAPKRCSADSSARGSRKRCSAGGQRLDLARVLAGVLGQDLACPRSSGTSSISQQPLLARREHALVGHDRHRPEHQDEAGLLLEVADDHPDRALRHVVGIGLHQRGLLGQDRVGPGPHQQHVEPRARGSSRRSATPPERRTRRDRLLFTPRQMSTGKEIALSAGTPRVGTKARCRRRARPWAARLPSCRGAAASAPPGPPAVSPGCDSEPSRPASSAARIRKRAEQPHRLTSRSGRSGIPRRGAARCRSRDSSAAARSTVASIQLEPRITWNSPASGPVGSARSARRTRAAWIA